MVIRKQYSSAYQVLELTEEVENLEQAEIVSCNMNEFAKIHLKEMVDLVSSFNGDNNNGTTAVPNKVVVTNKASGKPISDRQASTIKKQFARCRGIAEGLGITLNSESDVDNLSSSDGSKIIQAMFGNKTSAGF